MRMSALKLHIATKLISIEDELKSLGLEGISKMTLIARDPDNDDMLVCVSNDDLERAFQAAIKHEAK